MSKTLKEYIQMYEKHTGEKFQFNTGFSFFMSQNMACANTKLRIQAFTFGRCAVT